MNAVPRLDLSDLRSRDAGIRDRFHRDLRTALTEFGFVRVTGHGIAPDLIARVYAGFEAFFARSDAEKLRCSAGPSGQRGYTPVGVEHAKNRTVADLKEFYHVGRELDARHPLREQYPPNVWPDDADALREASLELYEALDRCAVALLQGLASGFGLPRDTFSSLLRDGNSILRALHYPPIPPVPSLAPLRDPAERALRAAPHEDINLITLLCEATDSGLEILTRRGEWLAVPAHPGELIVDAGDMLSRMTNDVIPSATHRVVAAPDTAARHRYALPYFAHPYPQCDLSVREAFVAKGAKPKYPPITAERFLHERLREIGLIA